MPFNRRQIVKTLTFAPFLSFANSAISVVGDSTDGPCNCINVLLHGLFFIEFQGDMLVAASPKHDGHKFVYKDHANPQSPEPYSGIIDLRNNLKKGSVRSDSFPNGVLHFSKTGITLPRKYFVDFNSIQSYACVLMLPIPEAIVPLRKGTINNFPAMDGNVKDSIIKLSGSDVGLSVRLKYFADSFSPPFTTRSYFAEHDHHPDNYEVNAALGDASIAFGKEFDLRIKDAKVNKVPPDLQKNLPDEVSPDDECALFEQDCTGALGDSATEPATCPIFGVVS